MEYSVIRCTRKKWKNLLALTLVVARNHITKRDLAARAVHRLGGVDRQLKAPWTGVNIVAIVASACPALCE